MDTELKNSTESAEMADCDDEKVVTMMDVLQDQEDFEEDANAVLGASDDKNCTYSKGYIKRQAIYACMTCCTEAKNDPTKRAGVCLACSLICHENHELIELYTKRNFKCDCGNAKFNSHPCQFTPNKVDINEDNSYNQNFSGIYCICHRPYPDPESKDEDMMIQCTICEDWLHASHLDATVPNNDQYSEMICKICMEKNYFLHDYSSLAVNSKNNVDLSLTNGIDNDNNKICNGDECESVNISSEHTILEPNIDVEMTEENTDLNISSTKNLIDNFEQKIDNEDINNISLNNITESEANEIKNKNIDNNTSKTIKEISIDSEKKNDEFMDIENGDLKVDSNSSNETSASVINEPIDKCADSEEYKITNDSIIEETIKDICMISGNTEKDIDSHNDSSTKDNTIEEVLNGELVDQQQANENKEIETESSESEPKIQIKFDIKDSENDPAITDSVAEPDCIDKSAEQIEEDKLLADPEDVNHGNTKKNKNSQQIAETYQIENDKKSENEDSSSGTLVKGNENTTSESEHESFKCVSDIDDKVSEPINIENINTEPEPIIDQQHDTIVEHNPDENAGRTKEILQTAVDEIKENNLDGDNLCKTGTENTAIESKQMEIENDFDSNVESVANNECQNVETLTNSNERGSDKRKRSTEENNELEVKKPKLDQIENEACQRPREVQRVYKGATFWPQTFRQKLCICRECITMYNDLSVLFLIDPEDTVTAYENLGKEKINGKPVSQYEKGLQALSSLDRIQQINALTEYNKMKDKLVDFLKSFKERKEVVKEEDIKAFFAGMKPKREPDGVYFCR